MENFLNDVIKERSDFAELSTKALRAAILEELAYAKHVREHMPNGVSLKRHFNAQEDTLHGLISKVNHICRVVKDADVSVKFYQKIMGARLLNRPRFATNGFWLWLGNVQLHLIQSSLTVVPDHDDAPAGRVNHMSFDVFNIQDCEERLTEAGVKFSKVITCPMTPLYAPESTLTRLICLTGVCAHRQRRDQPALFPGPGRPLDRAVRLRQGLLAPSRPLSVLHLMVPPLLHPSQFNDFVFGPFDEERAMEMARHYHEGMEPKVDHSDTDICLSRGTRATNSHPTSFPCHPVHRLSYQGAFVGALFMNMLARDHDASDAAETDNLLKETFVTFSGGKVWFVAHAFSTLTPSPFKNVLFHGAADRPLVRTSSTRPIWGCCCPRWGSPCPTMPKNALSPA